MRKEIIKTIITIIIGLACIVGVGLWTASIWKNLDTLQKHTHELVIEQDKTIKKLDSLTLPSPADIQTWLNILEPQNAIEIDGRIGARTVEKWDRCYCEQEAQKIFNKK